jgi:hypothetical protein
MLWCEFTFDAPHPENPNVGVRFVITTPVPSALGLRDGAILENHIFWQGGYRD